MSDELKGKVAIVTGGASGMGRETVRVFRDEGAKVVIADIAAAAGTAYAVQLGEAVRFRQCDVSKAADVEALVAYCVATFGRLDIMFNNAGVLAESGVMDFLDDDFSDFTKTMSVDLLGVLLGCRFAGKAMAKQGSGSIINTASSTATISGFGIPVYRAAKAGVVNITQNAALVLGQYGIRVNAISPGPIETPILVPGLDLPAEKLKAVSRAMMDVMIEAQPLKRVGQPIDIANAALFFASDRSAQITGQNLMVGGGIGLGDLIDRRVGIQAAVARALE